jgi:hypothetical protein
VAVCQAAGLKNWSVWVVLLAVRSSMLRSFLLYLKLLPDLTRAGQVHGKLTFLHIFFCL